MKDWASFRGLLWTCIECWLLENEGSGYYSILISIQAGFCYSFSFFDIIVLTSDSFFMVCMLFYCIVFLCHFSSFKINSLKIARCHQPDTEQDMVFQIMFPSYAYSWFCVVLKFKKLKWKTLSKKSVYIKTIFLKLYSTWYLCVQCIVLCYALISHSIETTDRWSDLILSYIRQHVNSLILTCMRRKQKSGLTNTL